MEPPVVRARNYRSEAAKLRAMAAREPEGSDARERLLLLAEEYDGLADRLEGNERS